MATNPSLDSAVVLSFSLVAALFIALVPLLTTIYGENLSSSLKYLILFGLLPIITYGITCIFNVFIQLIRCGSVQGTQVLINGLPGVAFVAALGFIASISSWARYPVESILPLDFSYSIKKGIAVSFFIFWGAVYGQAIGGSLSQSCGIQDPTPSVKSTLSTPPPLGGSGPR